jgi:hypothetical protein
VDVDGRGRAEVYHNFAAICYLLGVNGIRGQNIYPATFAPHVCHLRSKFASFTPPSKHLQV